MTIIASETKFGKYSDLVKASDTPEKFEFHTDVVTANEASQVTYSLGTVLGKVTSSGKYVVCVRTAVDGSQTPAAVVVGDGKMGAVGDIVVAATTDTPVLAITRGKVILSREALKLDASFDTAPRKQAAYDALKAVGLLVEASA
jgi:hypothetical protein